MLIIEEHYDNMLLLTKIEKILNSTLNHQFYSHYTIFARVQSFLNAVDIKEKNDSSDFDKDTIKYKKIKN